MIDKLNSILNGPIIFEKQTFINAFIATVSNDEAISLIEQSIDLPYELRRPIVRRVQNDIAACFEKKHHVLLKRLLTLLEQSKGNTREKIAYCIKELLVSFPEKESPYYIKRLLESQYVTTRRRAYALLRNHWIDDWTDPVVDTFHKYEDIEAARLFINNLPISYLEYSFELLDTVTCYDFIRRKLYLRLIEKSPSIIERLKDEDPVTYTYMRFKANQPLKHEEAIDLFQKAHPTDRSGIMIWAIGKMGLRKTLEELLAQWPKLERDIAKIPLEKRNFG